MILKPVKGHEQSGIRPVLVVQNNILNKRLPTTIVIPFTTNLKYKNSTLHYFLKKEKTKLKKDSNLILFQVRTIDKDRIVKKIFSIDRKDFKSIKRKFEALFMEI